MWWNDRHDMEASPPEGLVQHKLRVEAETHLNSFLLRIVNLYRWHLKVQAMGEKTK
jgi:hypothetical protein